MNETPLEHKNPMMVKEYTFSIVFIILLIELTVFALSEVGGLITASGGGLAIIGDYHFCSRYSQPLYSSHWFVCRQENLESSPFW
ncbi:hypothetical protein OCC_08030 [Thermococcus litoralis DSM 5473]|uniref:Uncharacterized protein n=1 Tax=Thermococcus litoralis (strain ATCC 51850 / DSM 5473 / JCM 8560 / NS-C) TaxID=523849 RepID=H3ZKJ4_THELN|nr:hypothetical protein OCC_08030 [Thermococcus litoralis DSM 5473]